MRICYFGKYARSADRNQTIINGLRKNNVDVVECFDNSSRRIKRWPKLFKKHSMIRNYDAIIVGYGGITDLPLAKFLTLTKKPLIVDPLISQYDTQVFNKKKIPVRSFKAKRLYLGEMFYFLIPNRILLDTEQHINYFSKQFHVRRDKFRRIFVGANDHIFFPREDMKKNKKFLVLFYGWFDPLHGIEYIVRSAKLLEKNHDIKFEIIGHGQESKKIELLSKKLKIRNISFISEVNYREIPNHIANANVCLGIFGNTEKAKRVIATKAFEALAMKKPLITGDSPAVREILVNKKHAILCRMADPKAICESVLLLKENEDLKQKISNEGYKLFRENFTQKKIGIEVKKVLEELL